MGYYRPRPVEEKRCLNCGLLFDTRHKRTLYCGESCRQLAYQARHRVDKIEQKSQPEAKTDIEQKSQLEAKTDLAFSSQNIGVTGTGAAVVAIANYMINDKPAQDTILDKLDSIEQGTEEGLNRLLRATQLLLDYVNVNLENNQNLKSQMLQLRTKRAEEAEEAAKQKRKAAAARLAKSIK